MEVASHVVECALLHSSPEERERLKNAMAGNAEECRLMKKRCEPASSAVCRLPLECRSLPATWQTWPEYPEYSQPLINSAAQFERTSNCRVSWTDQEALEASNFPQ